MYVRYKNSFFENKFNDKKAWILFIIFIMVILFVLRRNKAFIFVIMCIPIIFNFKCILELKFSKVTKLFLCFWIYYFFITLINFCINPNYIKHDTVYDLLFRIIIIFSTYLLAASNKEKNNYYFILFRNFGLILCVLGLIEFITKQSLFYNFATASSKEFEVVTFGTAEFRIRTMFLHPIVYGMFLVILYWIIHNYPIKYYYLNKLCILLVLVNLFATQSRSAWIPLIVTIAIDLLIKKKKNPNNKKQKTFFKRYILFGLIIILLFTFREELINIINSIILRFSIVLDPTSLDGSRTQRLGSMQNIIEFIKENKLSALLGNGLGYGTIFIINNPVNVGFNVIDNEYITCILENGIIGVVILISILFHVLINIKKYYINQSNRVAIMGIITIYISIFFYDGFTWYSTLYLLTVFIAILNKNCTNEWNTID